MLALTLTFLIVFSVHRTGVNESNFTNRCNHQKIMGNIEESAEPYIYPFIIEYSLIGAAVLYIMWKHIGPKSEFSVTFAPGVGNDQLDELHEIASQRSTAHVKVDCVGTSKGLFFGLLVLVGVVIAIILFFVLIEHEKYGFLSVYLGDVSHCVVLILSTIAIIIGFIRVRSLHFKTDKEEELSDLLLAVSSDAVWARDAEEPMESRDELQCSHCSWQTCQDVPLLAHYCHSTPNQNQDARSSPSCSFAI
ncbi:Proton channel OtopLc [Nymphon striatum]|nr:Proton channel OtopLc [Nymphon striatum]